jgi:pimeloyl-ACP methyl ester carboxylesterase
MAPLSSSQAPWRPDATSALETGRARRERLTDNGLLLRVRRLGAGDTVLLVHGLGVSSTYFGPLARLLAREMRVVAPDLPGWGGSDRPAIPLDVKSAACVLGTFIGAEGVAPPAVVANSFGCQVAVELAFRRPELVGALVLISPTVDPRFRSSWRQAQTLVHDSLREPPSLWPILARDYLTMGPRQLVAVSAAALRDRPESKLPRIDMPVLVIRGERDAITTRAWAARCALLARGTFASIPAAAHAPHFSHPTETAQLVSSFVSELADRGD